MRGEHRPLHREGLAHRARHLERQAHPVLEAAAVLVRPAVGERGEELVEEIAVRRVDLDHFERGLLGPPRGIAEGADHRAEVVARQLARHGVALGESQWARPDRLPAAASLAHRTAAAPGRLGPGLAPGVRELDGRNRSLPGDEAGDGGPRLRVRVRPEAGVVGADPPLGRDGARLGDHEPGPADRAAAEVHEVPLGGQAVRRRVLAHRRDGDAVAERRLAQPQGREERAHRRANFSAVTKRGSMSTGTSFSRSRTRCVSGRTTARRPRMAFAFA